MKYDKILTMAYKFAELSKTPTNEDFHHQRENLSKFYDHFTDRLRSIKSELSSEYTILKLRKFDPKMLVIFNRLQSVIIEVLHKIEQRQPYKAAESFLRFINNNENTLENLVFLSKEHLEKTNIGVQTGPLLGHPQFSGLEHLQELCEWVQKFMEHHPLIQAPSPSTPPPSLHENMTEIPAFFSNKNEKTKF